MWSSEEVIALFTPAGPLTSLAMAKKTISWPLSPAPESKGCIALKQQASSIDGK